MRKRLAESLRLRTSRKAGRLALVIFLTFSATVLVAGVLTGGIYQLIKTMTVSSGGSSSVTGGAFELAHSVGQPNATAMSGGVFSLTSGYHSEFTVAASSTPTISTTTVSAPNTVDGTPVGVPVNSGITVTFSTPMDPCTLNITTGCPSTTTSVTLVAVRSKVDTSLELPITATLSYDAVTHVLTVTPNSPLDTNTLYYLQVSTAAQGSGGAALASALSYPILTIFDHTVTNVFPDVTDGTKLLAPAGTFPANGYVIIKDDPLHAPDPSTPGIPAVIAQANAKLIAQYGAFANPILVREINAYDANNNRIHLNAANIASLAVQYQDNGSGFVTGVTPPVRSETTSLWVLDEANAEWVRLPTTNHDLTANVVTSPLPHISVFALIGALSSDVGTVYAYPVPWKPRSSDAARYGTLAGGVTFGGLPSVGTIKIYTLSGKLVRRIDHNSGSATETWLGTNEEGSQVASGVYLWEVDSNGNKKLGKLMVVW